MMRQIALAKGIMNLIMPHLLSKAWLVGVVMLKKTGS
jgi:hypothetical protein